MGVELCMSILFEPGDDGFIVASVPEVPGALSQGRTPNEAEANVIDAICLMLSAEPGATQRLWVPDAADAGVSP